MELEELYASPERLDLLREKVKTRDDNAVKQMFYFDIWKRLREQRGPFTLERKAKAMDDTLVKLNANVNLEVIYG